MYPLHINIQIFFTDSHYTCNQVKQMYIVKLIIRSNNVLSLEKSVKYKLSKIMLN